MRLRSKETFDGTEKPGEAAGAARSAATEGALPGFFTFLAVVLRLAPLWWLPPNCTKFPVLWAQPHRWQAGSQHLHKTTIL